VSTPRVRSSKVAVACEEAKSVKNKATTTRSVFFISEMFFNRKSVLKVKRSKRNVP
jgi:hypothetical protein